MYWHLPSYEQVSRILKNPRYAGAYCYSRYKNQRGLKQKMRHKQLLMEQWHTLIRDHHVGFIKWDELCANQDLIAESAKKYASSPSNSSTRKGAALLQSRVDLRTMWKTHENQLPLSPPEPSLLLPVLRFAGCRRQWFMSERSC